MKRHSSGFTIVELLVVIMIIGILATISVFAFGQWRARTATTEVKHELLNLQSKIKDYRTWNNTYPTSLAQMEYSTKSDFNYNTLTVDNATNKYCVGISSTRATTGIWYISNSSNMPTQTAC